MDWKFVVIVVVLILLVAALVYAYQLEDTSKHESFLSANAEMKDYFPQGTLVLPGDNAFAPKSSMTSELLKNSEEEPVPGSDSVVNESKAPYTSDQSAFDNYYSNLNGGNLPSDLYASNQLTAADLLPKDKNSAWAKMNPDGQGDLADKNFLEAGYHVGINTVGQSLRNANYQLRSDPPNPQEKVSPWMQTTIEPDTSRRRFEIGSA